MRLPLALRRAGAVTGAATLLTAAGLASGVLVGVASAQTTTAISPSAIGNTATGTTSFTISGSGFTAALDTVTLVPTVVPTPTANYTPEVKAITATVSTTASSSTALVVTATMTLAAPEPYDVVVSQASVPAATVSTCSGCLVVTNPGRPTVTSAINNGGGGGFAITGTNFAIGAKVEFLTPAGAVDPAMVFTPGTNTTSNGQTTHNTGYTSSTKLNGTYSITGTPVAGEHLIRVTNTDGGYNHSTTATFYQPTLSTVVPAQIGQGATNYPLKVNGAGIATGSTLGVSQCSSSTSDVTVGTATTATDGSSISAPVTITSDCTTAVSRTVSIQGPDGGYISKASALLVSLQPLPGDSNTGTVNLGDLGQGGSLKFTVPGENFVAGTAAKCAGCTTFTTDSPKVTAVTDSVTSDGTSAVVTFTAASDAPVGDLTTITATNPDGGTGSYVGTDTPIFGPDPLTIDAAPIVTGINPASTTAGKTGQSVTLTGTGFDTNGMSFTLGAGITVTSTTVSSATSAVVVITTNAAAAPGPRDVVATNTADAGTSTCPQCFGINSLTVSPTAGSDSNSTADVRFTASSGLTGATSVVLTRRGVAGDQPPITGTGLTNAGDTEVDATFDLTDAAPGLYNATVTSPTGTYSCTGCYTVTGHAFTITGITSNTGGVGATEFPVTIAGTGFTRGQVITIAGVTVDNVTFQSPTLLKADVTIPANATPASKIDVVAKSSDGANSSTLTGGYSIVAAPTVTSAATATPDKKSLGEGATGQVVKIGGTGFTSGSVPSFDSTGITVTNVSLVSATEIDATLSVADTAPTGARALTVTQSDNGGTSTPLASAITITAKPVLTQASPNTIEAGATQSVTFSGQGFQSGSSITAGDITFTNVTLNSDGTLTASAAASKTAAGGARTVTIANADGGRGTCSCLTVLIPTALTLSTATHSTAGDLVIASGVITNTATGADLGSLPISVTVAPRVGSSSTVTSNSSASGTYSRSIRPTYTSIISAYYLGDATHTAASAKNVTDTVSPKVLITSPGKGSSTKASTTLVIRGSVSPTLAGHIIGLYREFKTGYKGIAQATIASNGTYTVSVKLNKGSYYLKTGVGASTGNPAGFSTALLVKRT